MLAHNSKRVVIVCAAFFVCSCAEDGAVQVAYARTEPRALRFGVSPSQGAAETSPYGVRVAAYLSERTGTPVRTVVASSYAFLVRGTREGWVDFGWFPPMTYRNAARGGALRPLVEFVRGGKTGYRSAIITRADGPVRTLIDLRGRRIAWTDPHSSSGYLFPRAHVVAATGDVDSFFGEEKFVGSHREAVTAVLDGETDAAATFCTTDTKGEIADGAWSIFQPGRASEIRVVALTETIPSDLIAARRSMSDASQARVARAFVEMSRSEEGRQLLEKLFNADGVRRFTEEERIR